MENLLWYKAEPKGWDEGLPIGNGRLAAMVLNTNEEDVLMLNHENLWRGTDKVKAFEPCYMHLKEIRDILKKGEIKKGTILANDKLNGNLGGISGNKAKIDPYQPAGNLHFAFCEGKLKSRQLNIETGLSDACHLVEGGEVKSEFYAHSTENNILCRWTGNVEGRLYFDRVEDNDAKEEVKYENDRIVYNCTFNGGSSFSVVAKFITDGTKKADGDGIYVEGATYIVLAINIGTDTDGIENELSMYDVDFTKDWCELLKEHIKKFSAIMNRVNLDLGFETPDIPTDERIKNFKAGADDENLIVLYLNYGRYLLLASSICGKLPANLQGKWNDLLTPPWNCDYHYDINLEMNYWVAESGNLSECCDALFDFLELFLEKSKDVAKDVYGCRGLLMPLSGDAYGKTILTSKGYDVWVGAAPWMAQHYQKHYEYNGDKEFLKNRAYPFFKAVAEFYEDYLEEDENGVMQIIPSQSPENTVLATYEIPVSLGVSSGMDIQLAYDALTYAIKAAETLGVDEDRAKIWRSLRDNLPEFKIGTDGRLLEWDKEYFEKEPGHRHLSHLYGAFPSELFTSETRKEQFEACKKSLEYRMRYGGGHTGWSRAWVACLYARMGNQKGFYEHMYNLIVDFATTSLLDLHPPRIFQIDGNLGGAEAILQALSQSRDGKIFLLYALPEKWKRGSLCGVRAIGGHTLSIWWEDSKVTKVEIEMGFSEKAVLVLENGEEAEISGKQGEKKTFIR